MGNIVLHRCDKPPSRSRAWVKVLSTGKYILVGVVVGVIGGRGVVVVSGSGVVVVSGIPVVVDIVLTSARNKKRPKEEARIHARSWKPQTESSNGKTNVTLLVQNCCREAYW
jgi:hypothetical protein